LCVPRFISDLPAQCLTDTHDSAGSTHICGGLFLRAAAIIISERAFAPFPGSLMDRKCFVATAARRSPTKPLVRAAPRHPPTPHRREKIPRPFTVSSSRQDRRRVVPAVI